jgi:hypothetical protein
MASMNRVIVTGAMKSLSEMPVSFSSETIERRMGPSDTNALKLPLRDEGRPNRPPLSLKPGFYPL